MTSPGAGVVTALTEAPDHGARDDVFGPHDENGSSTGTKIPSRFVAREKQYDWM
ncbi:hypothetical protein [Mycobacteroides abscessus]|uniref:Uncharacterized protein n=1 Tax=Mycobacteroides abscessus subsp. bolletii 50594 TaxID=1303024 RepID=A0AB33AB65_9MYCO|nr:hypothetical protein [Mycobacteroides abscessus]AGM28938.1 hypothetical protein MASS_2336 [Mycobacteroides abscessus subsp. bolletii 50594]AMU65875.1 hypothetical protein A3O04_11755 [Mycobacteroides abscessus]AMU75304.1 hypothetical protein A3O06_12115 [Mycobacteroides abscessus]ANO14462.1 hypothetical protein BAB77_11855 [Mycobacteroides abscessus]ANO24248.1 hypothetical protein BAB79_12105 [Mycobacteroides abscessus]